ncbi:helix-turn-helix transcriptional regulator [Aquabacterium sp. OR-4]|uniref:helix-turn-helix transcriptional regulator n=1 Tax=Aquabacterium sp. OR-4 TaxID=2978127 RepID=UPI0021B27B48|nr:LuxR family transcriptional regulator [Aquabacterium sp. OR-4]MDT7833789.1 LuxR family transcriptional regulator [Aquabacterium sp. OR-4]
MLHGEFASVLQAGTREDFRGEVVRFAQRLGFDTVSVISVVDLGINRLEIESIDNAPAGYADSISDTRAARRDPVMQHCRKQSVPIVWNQDTYTREGLGDLWEEQAHFGYCTGIAMALHLPQGRHFAMGVERDQPLPSDRGELTRIVADLQLFAVHALDAAMRVLTPGPAVGERTILTPREIEVLHWTMEGKTAWEVGAILGISERTAVLHINNAMHKLECGSKHQAVLKALRLGLIG